MNCFEFQLPTQVVFGKGVEARVGEMTKPYGSRVLLVYGGASAEKSGLLQRVKENLQKEGLTCFCLGGVQANPLLELVYQGIQLCKQENIDFILAVGGGSVIDTAKAVGIGYANPKTDVWKFFMKEEVPEKITPIGAILTISAAGSEMSDCSVITNEKLGLKRALSSPLFRIRFVLMNPELTYTLPKYQIACGICDIMMHTMERYFCTIQGNDVTDRIGEAVLKTVIEQGRTAVKNPQDYHAMSEIMWCSSLSHNDLTGLGGEGDFSVHQLGHELSAKYGAAHGASLAAMWPTWARMVYHSDLPRFALFARNVWGIEEADDEKAALAGIQAVEDYFTALDLPKGLKELCGKQLPEEDLQELAEKCTFFGKRQIGSFHKMGYEEILKVYQSANR